MKLLFRVMFMAVAIFTVNTVSAAVVTTVSKTQNGAISFEDVKKNGVDTAYIKSLSSGIVSYEFSVSSLSATKKVGSYILSLLDNKNVVLASTGSSTGGAVSSFIASLTKGIKYQLVFTSLGVKQSGTLNIAAVPEPETYALMGVGLLGLLVSRRRKVMAS